MRVVYSDETGTGDIKDQPVIVVTALMVNFDKQSGLLDECFAPLANIVRLLDANEIKGRKVLKFLRRHPHSHLDRHVRALLSTLARNSVPVFYEAIDRAGFEVLGPSTPPYEFAFLFRELFDGHDQLRRDLGDKVPSNTPTRFFDEKNLPPFPTPTSAFAAAFEGCAQQVSQYVRTMAPDERVLWIADHGGRSYEALKEAMLFHKVMVGFGRAREHPEEFRLAGHINTGLGTPYIDTIYFGDSKESILLQVVDLCCSIISAHLRGTSHVRPYLEILRTTIVADRGVSFASH